MKRRLPLLALSGLLCFAAVESGPTKELQDGVRDYMRLREKALQGLPKLKDKAEPEAIKGHESAALERIRAARPEARQGDVLSKSVQEYLRDTVRGTMTGRRGKPAKETAKEGNPASEGGASVPLRVNAAYPDSAPLSTVPPSVLLRLPQLPKELEFRFVGRSLVLRDKGASMVVDFVTNVIPPE